MNYTLFREASALDEYITWDYTQPGISFNIESGRITIFKQTLVEMGYPEFFRFLFSPEEMIFGIEPCGIDDGGAHRFPDKMLREHYDIKSKGLVRFVYDCCGWRTKLTYRIAGRRYAPDKCLVYFDLREAFEIHEGRLKEAR